jgi:hypothetical protein
MLIGFEVERFFISGRVGRLFDGLIKIKVVKLSLHFMILPTRGLVLFS